MRFYRLCLVMLVAGILAIFLAPAEARQLNTKRLSAADIHLVENILEKLDPLIGERKAQSSLAHLDFSGLYAPLNKQEQAFIKKILKLKAHQLGLSTPFLGIQEPPDDLVAVATQTVVDEGKTVVLPARYLPRQVYDQYVAMMEAMEQDIGQRAYIESGYRSPAYQLYLLLSFLKKYNYSLKTAARRAALPGYSEHGAPHRQAIDFAVETSSADAAAGLRFHDFPPYRWMADHAADHGFYLSYPDKPGPGVGFESWHWHFEDPVTAQISPDTATAKQ